MDNKTKISYTVVIGIVCLLLLTCRCMTGKIPKKMALIVDQIELAGDPAAGQYLHGLDA